MALPGKMKKKGKGKGTSAAAHKISGENGLFVSTDELVGKGKTVILARRGKFLKNLKATRNLI